MSFLGTLYAVSLYFQDGRGMDPLEAGLAVFPEALGVMVGAQLASRYVIPRLGPRRTITLGLTGVTLACVLLATLGADTSLWFARAWTVLLGLSMAHVFVTGQAVAFATVPPARTGQASTLFNALRQVGGAAGFALIALGLAQTIRDDEARQATSQPSTAVEAPAPA